MGYLMYAFSISREIVNWLFPFSPVSGQGGARAEDERASHHQRTGDGRVCGDGDSAAGGHGCSTTDEGRHGAVKHCACHVSGKQVCNVSTRTAENKSALALLSIVRVVSGGKQVCDGSAVQQCNVSVP